MEAIGFVVALAILGLLAVRFGPDRREGFRSKGHALAARGVTRRDLACEPSAPSSVPAAGDEPLRDSPVGTEPYPTLAFIERALGHAARVLTAATDAAALERRARALVADHWSDAVWTTGVVPEAAFRRVLADLAPDVLRAWGDPGPTPDVVEVMGRVWGEPAVADGATLRTGRAAA